MPQYAARLVGNVTNRWTAKGQAQEMEVLSANLTGYAQDGWHLHTVQPVPVFGGFSGQQQGIVLLAVRRQPRRPAAERQSLRARAPGPGWLAGALVVAGGLRRLY
jgi:hypothetical protein